MKPQKTFDMGKFILGFLVGFIAMFLIACKMDTPTK